MPRLPPLSGFALAVGATGVALALSILSRNEWGPAATYSFFLAAVMLSSWRGGLAPGLFSTFLGVLATDYFLIEPVYSFTLDTPRVIQLVAFMISAGLISSLNGARARAVAALVVEQEQLEARVVARTRELGERVKELTTLHAAARLLHESTTSGDVWQRVVELLPSAWQYPSLTAARITVGDDVAETAGFTTTPWMQSTSFSGPDGTSGTIEIAYLGERPRASDGPFLADERRLLESLASLMCSHLERLARERDHVRVLRAEAAQLEAQDANRAKDQFLATLSHELRAPLNVMLGWTSLLRSGRLGSEAAVRGLDVLERNVELQAKLIEDLLDVSRMVTGKLRLQRERVDVAVIAREVVYASQPSAAAKKLVLRATTPEPAWVDADPARIQQIISNLLNNALKFTPENGTVSVQVAEVDGSARIEVIDSGIGMSPESVPRVFERFHQDAGSIVRSHDGLGLGLAIVRRLVELHGGTCEASSAGPGMGSTFTVTLPLAREDATPRDAGEHAAPADTGEPSS